jgi:ethanolamine utilization protein EutP (predicted NTPase)
MKQAQIEQLKNILKEFNLYTAHNKKKCFKSIGGLDYFYLLAVKFNLKINIFSSGLYYEAKNKYLSLIFCEHDIIIHIKKRNIFKKVIGG